MLLVSVHTKDRMWIQDCNVMTGTNSHTKT